MATSEYGDRHHLVECDGQVLTIRMRPPEPATDQREDTPDLPGPLALANLFDRIRADDRIRIIVLHRGGPSDGFPTSLFRNRAFQETLNEPGHMWRLFSGIIRLHEVMASIEKPIVAQVNGDVSGGACYMMLAADLIVACKDARFFDHHLGMGAAEPIGSPFGLVPGDGGVALAPLYFTPPLAKEFLMLAKEYTAEELAHRGIINYAVAREKLDATVADIVRRLLERPAYPLAWAKRIANRHVIDQLNRTLDAGAAYEMLGMSQLERQGWIDRTTLS